jgi:acyl-CoA synthetase (AMP-forming)/AMP-acid ligase II
VEAIGLNGTDRYGLLMPFFHMAAGGMLVALLMLGATGVLLPRRDPAALMASIERERVTRLNLPAATLRDLRDANLLRRLPDVAWLAPGNGSEQDLLQLLAERVTPNVWGWYGQTEATNITTAPRSTQEALRGFGCIGRAALTARIRVVKADGTAARPGEVGELWTAGPHVMAGYWQRPDETAAAMAAGEWLRSGDLVRCDADGTLFIVDRLKEMIKSGGETIYPRELEVVLERHAGIAEAAVIGVAHPRWGESPRALVVRRPGVSLDEAAVTAHCRAHLAPFKRPTSVVFVDALPRNAAGKVRKDLLRRQWGTPGVAEQWRVA